MQNMLINNYQSINYSNLTCSQRIIKCVGFHFQILFTCLNSFLRLQALFSCSSWESLNKLTRNFEDPQDCSAAPHPPHPDKAEVTRSNDAISGHFTPLLGRFKPYQSSGSAASNTFNNNDCSIAVNNDQTYQSIAHPSNVNSSPTRVWKNAVPPCSDHSRSDTPVSCSSSPKKSFQGKIMPTRWDFHLHQLSFSFQLVI